MTSDAVKTLTRRVIAAVRRSQSSAKGARTRARSPMVELLLGVLKAETTERSALVALNRLERAFVDWNEVRASSAYEIADVMEGSPAVLDRARRVRGVLRRVFESMNDLSLEGLAECGSRDAQRLVAQWVRSDDPADYEETRPLAAPELSALMDDEDIVESEEEEAPAEAPAPAEEDPAPRPAPRRRARVRRSSERKKKSS